MKDKMGGQHSALKASDYDAIALGTQSVGTLLARGVDTNATARCLRLGVSPAPLWRAVAAFGDVSEMECLLNAGCFFKDSVATLNPLSVLCLGSTPAMTQWYLNGVLSSRLASPATDYEREQMWMSFSSMISFFWAPKVYFSIKKQHSSIEKITLCDEDETAEAHVWKESDAWDSSCIKWAHTIARVAGEPAAEMFVNLVGLGTGSALSLLLDALPPSAQSAQQIGFLIEDAVLHGNVGEWELLNRGSLPKPARAQWCASVAVGQALGRAGIRLSLDTAARSGNAYVLALAVGSGAKPVLGCQELALFVAGVDHQSNSPEDFLLIALGPRMGKASKPGMACCAVESLARAGCSYIKTPKKRPHMSIELSAEATARRYIKKNPQDDPMGFVAVLGSIPGGGAANRDWNTVLQDDRDLPSSMAAFARFITRMSEREHIEQASAKADAAPKQQRL